MATRTIEQYLALLKRQRQQLGNTRAVFVAASTAHADRVERIFTRGEAVNGSKIGNYDTTDPIYVNPADSPRGFATKGKAGKTTFGNGRPHKTGYFRSYKAFRESVSRPTAFVNLDLFGRLKQEDENGLRRLNNFSFEARLRTEESIDKATGNQRRFGKAIFGATQAERDTFRETMMFEINRIINA